MKKLTCFLFLLLASSFSFATDWQFAAGNDKTFYNIDFDSITSAANKYRKAWVKANYVEDQRTDGYPTKSYRSELILYYFDCKEKTLNATQSVMYEKFNAAGDVIQSKSIKFDAKNLDDVVPGSVGETLLNITCGTPAARAKLKAKNEADARKYMKDAQEQATKLKEEQSSSPST
jgi:hypothetical protein